MSGRVFLDINMIIYLYSKSEDEKRNIAYETVNNADCIISTQVMNESSNIWFKKYNLNKNEIIKYLSEIESICEDLYCKGEMSNFLLNSMAVSPSVAVCGVDSREGAIIRQSRIIGSRFRKSGSGRGASFALYTHKLLAEGLSLTRNYQVA